MTLPASGTITMAQVLAELQTTNPSRTTPISLNDSDVRTLAGVASGTISMSNLHGKSAGATWDSFGGIVWAVDISSPYNATAGITLNGNGTISTSKTPVDGGSTFSGATWGSNIPGGVGNGLWLRVVLVSGTLTGGTTGTWLELNTSRSWTKNRASLGVQSTVLTFEFARSNGGTVEASRSVTLRAEGAA
jgi:hypothetical protein